MPRPARDPRARMLQEFAAYDKKREKDLERSRALLNSVATDLAKMSKALTNGRRPRRVK